MQRAWPAYSTLSDIVRGQNKNAAWRIVAELVRTVPTPLLQMVGAGPLEDFVKANADDYIDELERHADRSPRWRKALKHVWFRPSETAVAERLIALGCTGINLPPHRGTERQRTRRKPGPTARQRR